MFMFDISCASRRRETALRTAQNALMNVVTTSWGFRWGYMQAETFLTGTAPDFASG